MLNRFGKSALIVVVSAFVILAVAWNASNAAPPAQATETPTSAAPPVGTPTPGVSAVMSDIGVTGTGKVSADPDTALAMLGVEISSRSLASANADASQRMTAVLARVKSLGVDPKDITTVSYNVYPQTNNPKEGEVPQIIGYHVSNVVQVKIRKIKDVGQILDGAMNAGANTLNSLTFTIDDPKPFQEQARTQAVKEATRVAQTLADAAGVKLGKLTSLTENVTVRPVIDKAFAAPAAAGGGGPGPIESGQNEISVTVEMHFEIVQ